MHGQFVWYELTTPDVDAARKFYPRFTGWGTQAFDNDYTMFTSGGVPVAGLFRLTSEMRDQGVPPNWMPYIEADAVDDTVQKAKSLGGTVIVPPKDIPGTGRFAVLQDPQGAVFGIYKAAGPSMSWDGSPVVGKFSWFELMTTDHRKAFEFYRALFGWKTISEMDMGGGNMYSMFGQQQMFGGMFDQTPEMAGMHPFWLLYICVKNVPKAVESAVKGGATVQRPPMDIPGGVIAILGDPQGAGFAVHHVSAPAVSSAAKDVAPSASRPRAKAKAARTAGGGKTKAQAARTTGGRNAKTKAARTAARGKTKTKAARTTARGKTKSKAAKVKATRAPARRAARPKARKTNARIAKKKTARPAGRARAKRKASRGRRR